MIHPRPSMSAVLILILVGVVGTTQLYGDNWPQWRGPDATGVSTETRLPDQWSESDNVAWRTGLGGVGISSPIVWEDQVFVTSQIGAGVTRQGPRLGQGANSSDAERSLDAGNPSRDGRVRFLIESLHRVDGRVLWTHTVAAEGDLPSVHDKHNLASASPVTDGIRVYAVFGTGQVVAVDMTGREVWARHLGRDFGAWTINWGNGSSPIVYGDSLIILAFNGRASYLLALDRTTGRRRWKTDKPRGVTSYSTPVVVPGPDGDELIVNSSTGVEGYDPTTGERLWYFNEQNDFPIPVAMYHGGVIYVSRGYRSGPYAAIRPGGRGDIANSHVIWHVPTGAPYISSIVYYDGLIYMAGDVGVITCVDAATGEQVWRERLGGVYTASPVAADGKIYLLSESGETIVLRAGRTPEVLSRNRIHGRVLASPAISRGQLFIRTDGHVLAVGRSS